MATKIDKTALKEAAIVQLFKKRLKKAREEYEKAIEGTIFTTQVVNYRNNLLNPLQLKPIKITGVYEIEPDSPHGKALDRFIRCNEEIHEITGHLTYILNFVESREEFNFIIFNTGSIKGDRKDKVLQFIKDNEDKLKLIKRLRLLAEIV